MTTTFAADALLAWATSVLERLGCSPDDARYLADTLVDANLRGIDSHGVIRLPIYSRRFRSGLVNPGAEPVVSRDRALVRIDANGAPGQLAARRGVAEAVAVAREHGLASVSIRGSAHFGTAGYYARELAGQGFLAMVVTNSEPTVVPHGGRQAFLGTNPFAFAAPTSGRPFSLDMATSTVAMGKVLVALTEGRSIPADWGVDAEGRPTTDPAAVVAATPAGGPKGYGLAFMVELLAGVLSGAAVAGELGNMYADFDRPQNVGHWMLALDIGGVLPVGEFAARAGGLVEQAHAQPPAPGFAAVLAPGEPEELTRERRLAEGVPLPGEVVVELAALGDSVESPLPERNPL